MSPTRRREQTGAKVRLVIADDHAIVRAGLKQLFALVDDLVVVGEAASGAELMELLRDGLVDQVLLDLTMPGTDGCDLIARIRAHYPRLPILVLTMHLEPEMTRRALIAGASGYLTKDSEPEVLLAAIRKVAAGGRFIDPVLAEQMAFETLAPGTGPRHLQLTDREFQILRLLARGVSINGAADQLAISNKTVSTHKVSLMRKMGFRSNAELVRYAVHNALVD